jgi:uncharacterized protein DUF1918
MNGRVGDRLVVERTQGATRRVGIIVATTHSDGSPPYKVRWLDTGRESLIFPEADAHIEHASPDVPS